MSVCCKWEKPQKTFDENTIKKHGIERQFARNLLVNWYKCYLLPNRQNPLWQWIKCRTSEIQSFKFSTIWSLHEGKPQQFKMVSYHFRPVCTCPVTFCAQIADMQHGGNTPERFVFTFRKPTCPRSSQKEKGNHFSRYCESDDCTRYASKLLPWMRVHQSPSLTSTGSGSGSEYCVLGDCCGWFSSLFNQYHVCGQSNQVGWCVGHQPRTSRLLDVFRVLWVCLAVILNVNGSLRVFWVILH